jgi:hypothetical protein
MKITQKTIALLLVWCSICSGVTPSVYTRTGKVHPSLSLNPPNGVIQGVVLDA